MKNTETPKTDAHLDEQLKLNHTYSVTPEFARNLEREADRLREALNDIACGAACLNGYGIEEASRTAREAIENSRIAPTIFGPCQEFINGEGRWCGVPKSMYGMKISE